MWVREKFHPVKVCTVLEAAEEMENLGHAFYAFRNVVGLYKWSLDQRFLCNENPHFLLSSVVDPLLASAWLQPLNL